MGVVTFDYASWQAEFPEFAGVTEPVATSYFNRATRFQNNTDTSIVTDLAERAAYLNLLTAHIASMNGSGVRGRGASGIVGRVTNGSKGSVSVAASYREPTSASEAWATQSTYGAEWWAATSKYRHFRYAAQAPRNFEPYPRGRRLWQ